MTPKIYLFFNGDCWEAMSRYTELLGGEVSDVVRNSDAPDEESRMPGGDDMVMNMSLRLGDMVVMASDSPEAMYDKPQGFRVQIETPTRADFDRLYEAFSHGAREIAMPADETFWAERFAMLTDRHGTPWMLNFTGSRAEG